VPNSPTGVVVGERRGMAGAAQVLEIPTNEGPLSVQHRLDNGGTSSTRYGIVPFEFKRDVLPGHRNHFR